MPFKRNSYLNAFSDYNQQEIEDPVFFEKLKSLPNNIKKTDIDEILKNVGQYKYDSYLRAIVKFLSERSNNKVESIHEVVKFYSLFLNDFIWWEERKEVFSEDFLNNMIKEVMNVKYSNKNSLNQYFSDSRGFNIEFKINYKDKVIKYFPFFKDYINAVIDESDEANVFFMNVLILENNTKVMRHADQSMSAYDPYNISYPARVSVLYVDVPEIKNGNLVLFDFKNEVFASITPERNKLVYFKGNLQHEVTELTNLNNDKRARISLVCEQYKINEEGLKNIPNFKTDVPRSVWYKRDN